MQIGGQNIDHDSVFVPWGTSDIFFPTGECVTVACLAAAQRLRHTASDECHGEAVVYRWQLHHGLTHGLSLLFQLRSCHHVCTTAHAQMCPLQTLRHSSGCTQHQQSKCGGRGVAATWRLSTTDRCGPVPAARNAVARSAVMTRRSQQCCPSGSSESSSLVPLTVTTAPATSTTGRITPCVLQGAVVKRYKEMVRTATICSFNPMVDDFINARFFFGDSTGRGKSPQQRSGGTAQGVAGAAAPAAAPKAPLPKSGEKISEGGGTIPAGLPEWARRKLEQQQAAQVQQIQKQAGAPDPSEVLGGRKAKK
jgi:hypothetical protein